MVTTSREDVREWIAHAWSHDITVREWWRRLAEARLSQPQWPSPYGQDWSTADARVVIEELAAAGTIAPPEGGEFVRSRIRGSRLVTLNATGHCPQLAAPEETAAAITGFVGATRR